MPHRRSFALTSAAALIAVASIGCAHSGTLLPGPATVASASARVEQRVPGQGDAASRGSGYAYIADALNPGHIFVYALPLTASSQPIRQLDDLVSPGSTGFDPGQVFVLVAGSPPGLGILVYEPKKNGPISFVLPTPVLPEMLEVDKGGNVFEGQWDVNSSTFQINVFKYPITKTSKPAFTINAIVDQSSGFYTRGMNFDAHGNLWVKDDDNQTMDKFAPPFSSKSKPVLSFPKGSGSPYGSLIFDARDAMFVPNGNGVDVYEPPFTRKTVKAFTIAAPAATILAIDHAGDLYVTSGNGVVYVFAPPFSASSEPKVTMPIPGKPNYPFISIRQ